MHTPAGYEMRDGVAFPVDWWAIVFNPSFPYRLAHMLNASYLTAGFVVLAVSARYLLKGDHVEEARTMMRMAIGLLAVLAPLQIFLGDQHGLNTLKHQPTKVAAMEAHWDGSKPGDFHIFAWPDAKAETNLFEISIPHGSSLILTHEWNGLFPGLEGRAAGRPAAARLGVLRLPHHDRDRLLHGGGGACSARSCGGAARCSRRAGICGDGADLVDGLRRGDRRLGGDRERPPALDRAGHPAHRRRHLAGDRPRHRGDLRAVRRGLRHRVFRRHLFHQPPDRQGPAKPRDAEAPAVSLGGALAAAGKSTGGDRHDACEWLLPLIWAGIIGSAVALYVILDGFDLGIGMLFPFAKDDGERDQMMASIAPFWDGNETWLVLGGVGLLVAFPLAYAIIMPAFYLPVIVMLLALVFRGVAFEFREIGANKTLWNTAFAGGSTLAGFAQGVILGGLIQGIAVKDGAYAGGTFDWATPFALLCGVRRRRSAMRCSARPG